MALNRVREEADKLSLPVPNGTKSGDPLVLGDLPCVAVVDQNQWTPSAASVQCDGSFRFDVTDTGGGIVVGTSLYLQNDGTLNDNNGGKFFGYALEAVDANDTAAIEVKVGH